MLAGAKSYRRPKHLRRAHRRARGPTRSSQQKTCRRRSQLCAALLSCGKTRCKPQPFYEVAPVTTYYTFGHDEIAQRVVERDSGGTITSDATHTFGHDGHGSVRVLYNLAGTAAKIAQVFTFAAYGELLALHNSLAVSSPLASRLSSLGYSGEHFDAKAQQQHLRARFYNPANGRFNRLDPFAGNMQDPQSLHKYTYVHGDPIQGIDPTGMSEFSTLGTIGAIGIATAGIAISRINTQMMGTIGEIESLNFDRFIIDIDIVRVNKSASLPVKESTTSSARIFEIKRNFKIAESYSARQGFFLRVRSFREVTDDGAFYVAPDASGVNETREVVDRYYLGVPVLVFNGAFVEDFFDAGKAYAGLTSYRDNGAVLQNNSSGGELAHEIGHIFGLEHEAAGRRERMLDRSVTPNDPYNLMYHSVPSIANARLTEVQRGLIRSKLRHQLAWTTRVFGKADPVIADNLPPTPAEELIFEK